jgi:transketolase
MMTPRSTRDALATALVKLACAREDIIVLDADLSRSTQTDMFGRAFPERFFNLGIAEQNLFGMAAGLSAGGLTPFATTYAIFLGRGFDQIRQSICFGGTNVKIIATHAGLAASYDGGSHQAVEDLALMRVLPGMTILSPTDYPQAVDALLAAAEHSGPVYIRLQKEPVPVVHNERTGFTIGPVCILRPGYHVVIVATGSMVHRALQAAESLVFEGVDAEVMEVATIKPLDTLAIRDAARRCGAVVVAEEHSRIGGLHDAVLHALAGSVLAPVVPLALDDRFGTTGSWHELLEYFGLTQEGIVRAALLARRIASGEEE